MLHLAAIQAIAFVWPATGRQWTTTHCENFVTDGVLHIPEGATVIGESSFESCESLWKIIWPDTVLFIEDYAFRDSGLNGTLVLPPNLKGIGYKAFSGIPTLEKIVTPPSLRVIGESAFSNQQYISNLEIELAEGLEYIKTNCFNNREIDTLVIPSTVRHVEIQKLKVKTLILRDPSFTTVSRYLFDWTPWRETSTFNVPYSLPAYRQWDAQYMYETLCDGELSTPPSVPRNRRDLLPRFDGNDTVINDLGSNNAIEQGLCVFECTFMPCSEFNEKYNVTIGHRFESLTIIPETTMPEDGEFSSGAFGLKYDLEVENGVRVIPNGEYDGQPLGSITLPEGLEYIGNYGFSYAPYVRSIHLPSTLKWIGKRSFMKTCDLEHVSIPISVEVIETAAFNHQWCHRSMLKSLTFAGSGIKVIGKRAFQGTALEGVLTLPGSLISVKDEAFAFTRLSAVVFDSPSSTFVGFNAFKYITTLRSVNAPHHMTRSSFEDSAKVCTGSGAIEYEFVEEGWLEPHNGTTLLWYHNATSPFTIPPGACTLDCMPVSCQDFSTAFQNSSSSQNDSHVVAIGVAVGAAAILALITGLILYKRSKAKSSSTTANPEFSV